MELGLVHSLQRVVAYTVLLWVMDVRLTSRDREQQRSMCHLTEMEETR